MQHISPKEFQCKQCSYSTLKFSKLLVHVQKIHMGNIFTTAFLCICHYTERLEMPTGFQEANAVQLTNGYRLILGHYPTCCCCETQLGD